MTQRHPAKKKGVFARGTPLQVKLPPGLPSLKIWFDRSEIPLTEDQYAQLWRFHRLLRARNAAYDLTRIHQFDNMVQKHYIDCILVARLLGWRLPSPILDIGTGAGLPGIPLKVACPEARIILSEGRQKRVQFLREVVEALSLEGVEIYGKKIQASFSRPVQAVITRALETIPKTLARVQGCLVSQGKAIFMKGPHCDEEVRMAVEAFGGEYGLVHDIPYTIPHTPHRRRLVVFQRRPLTQG